MPLFDPNRVFVFTENMIRVPENVRFVRIHRSVEFFSISIFECCKSSLEKVIFDEGSRVRRMPDNVFHDCLALQSLDLSNCMQCVALRGISTFYHCEKLTSLDLPHNLENVERLHCNSFEGCPMLTHVRLSPKLKHCGYGRNPFSSCDSLVSLEVPEG